MHVHIRKSNSGTLEYFGIKNEATAPDGPPQSFTIGPLLKATRALLGKAFVRFHETRTPVMYNHRLCVFCVTRESAMAGPSPALFLDAFPINELPIYDAKTCGGRPAALKHFGFNVSPPLEF